MRISYRWLQDYINELPSPDIVAETLTAIGLEVEEILTFTHLKNFYVARIEEAVKHPNADKLSLCQVRISESEVLSVVCGAPNVRAGMQVAYAPVGTTMPSGLKIRKSKIRGEVSNGMLCSRDELGLASRTSRGIMEINDSIPLETPLATALNLDSVIFNICVTPNRGDCLGARGVARELAAKLNLPFTEKDFKPLTPSFTSDISITSTSEAQEACPHFLARVIRNVKNIPSPDWLQTRLREAGGSPISALVDITNYLLFDKCRPLHVFDKKSVGSHMHLRMSHAQEKFLGLDDQEYTLPDNSLVIADQKDRCISLAGIMGGKNSGSYEETTDIILECAYFTPHFIGKTGQLSHIITEARSRFERTVDAQSAHEGIERATQMILDMCGGEAGSIVEHGSAPDHRSPLILDEEKYERFIGSKIPENAHEILKNLGYTHQKDKTWVAPSWRSDVQFPEDIFADLWRLSYNNADAGTPLPVTQWHTPSEKENYLTHARTALHSSGYCETTPFIMINQGIYEAFGGQDTANHIQNPISQDLAFIRPNLASTLILAVKQNVDRKIYPVKICEVGPAYTNITPEGRSLRIGGVLCGPFNAHHWGHKSTSANALMAKGDVYHILESMGLITANVATKQSDLPTFCHPGQSAHLLYEGKSIGMFGVFHPTLVDTLMKTTESIAFFELFLDEILECVSSLKDRVRPQPQPLHHTIHRDLVFIMNDKVLAQDIIASVRKQGSPWITNVRIFDRYIGQNVPEGKISLGIHLDIQPQEHPLTDAEIQSIVNKTIDCVTNQFQAQLRQ